MKKLLSLIIVTLFLIGFVFAKPAITSKASEVDAGKIQSEMNSANAGAQSDLQSNTLTQSQIQEKIKEQNKLKVQTQTGECPEGCTCTGSSIKCQLQNGREMTITAGNSGNIIVQSKSVNASTNVELYKDEEGKIYGTFKNEEVKEVKILPDEVKEKVKEKISQKLEEEQIELNEEGTYKYEARQKARLLGLFQVRQRIRAEVSAETGELERVRKPWWSFLAKDVEEETSEE